MAVLALEQPGNNRLFRTLARLVERGQDLFQFGESRLWPLLDLMIRLWLAQTFWVSGIVKIADWNQALYLAANEYPVSWMDPVTAATLGVTVELLGPVMLLFGLGTRFAALALLALSLVIQFAYLALAVHLFWAVLLGWYVVMGAGPISLDRPLARGLASSAVPFAAALIKVFAATRVWLGPVYNLFLRYWIGSIFLASGLTKLDDYAATRFLFEQEYRVPILSPGLAAAMSTFFELACPVLLVAGLATRLAALPLIAMTLVIQFSYQAHIDHFYWLLLLGLIVLRGPGKLSLDHPLRSKLHDLLAYGADMAPAMVDGLPRVVIVGGGFAGLAAARGLAKARCKVVLIDQRNYHLFQPLLYQVATAGLSPADIATPIRGLFREQANATVLLGRVTGVDPAAHTVMVADRTIAYDYLVLATGAQHSYFGRDEWAPFAPGLKAVEDATDIRRRLLSAFERAENSEDQAERSRLLTFVIVGGGPTGVELAGAIAELARRGMEREFRNIDPATARVVLVQSAPRLLPTFPETLSAIAAKSLSELGVEVRLGGAVETVDGDGVVISSQRLEARTVFWAAGVIASPAAKWLGAEADRAGRVKVKADLSVPGFDTIFAIGDTALADAWHGKPVPGLAPAAKQGGGYVAQVIRARLDGRAAPGPFRYRHLGSLATIGRKVAVADFSWLRLSGTPAWWLWGLVHIFFLAGMRNRISVALDWFWAYLTFRSGTRLITGA